MSKKKEYIIAAIILVLGCAISAFILFIPKKAKPDIKPPTDTEISEQSEGVIHIPDENLKTFTVNFYDENGNVLESKSVKEGKSALPPDYSKEDYIFKGWNGLLFSIASDIDVYPNIEPLAEDKNIIFADAVYTQNGQPLTVSAKLSGEVNCCDFVIEASYDSELLSFKEIRNAINGLTAEDKKDEGMVILKYSGETISEQTLISDMVFDVNMEGMYSSKLVFATKEIHKKNDAGMVEYTDSVAYETNIFILN